MAGPPRRRLVVGAVDELRRRRIIRKHAPASYDFSHDLLRDTAYGEIRPPRRRLLHRRVAMTYHHERADRPVRAAPHHVRGAEAMPWTISVLT